MRGAGGCWRGAGAAAEEGQCRLVPVDLSVAIPLATACLRETESQRRTEPGIQERDTAQGQSVNRLLTSKGYILGEPINLIQIKPQLLIGLGPGKGGKELLLSSLGCGHGWGEEPNPPSPTALLPLGLDLLTFTIAWVLHPGPPWFLLRASMVLGLHGSWGHSRRQVLAGRPGGVGGEKGIGSVAMLPGAGGGTSHPHSPQAHAEEKVEGAQRQTPSTPVLTLATISQDP